MDISRVADPVILVRSDISGRIRVFFAVILKGQIQIKTLSGSSNEISKGRIRFVADMDPIFPNGSNPDLDPAFAAEFRPMPCRSSLEF